MQAPNSPEGKSEDVQAHEWLSALADGECPYARLDDAMQAHGSAQDTRQAWAEYHLVGEVLRGRADCCDGTGQQDFVAGVMARIRQDEGSAFPIAPDALQPVAQQGADAANESVFRWKLVAGVAALTTVATIAWQMTASERTGPVLAQGSAPAAVAPVAVAQGGGLMVQTGQGVVLRDAQLEALMAAHRQFGAVSALQAPAGFMRNATYEVPQR